MYKEMIKKLDSVLLKGTLIEYDVLQVSSHIKKFNKDKA